MSKMIIAIIITVIFLINIFSVSIKAEDWSNTWQFDYDNLDGESNVEAFIWNPSTGYGSMPHWKINKTYAKDFLKDNMKWHLQASNDNSTWYNASELLEIGLNWNEDNCSYKVTLTLNTTLAPKDLYYRFYLACNKSLKNYAEIDGYEWTLTVPVTNTSNYTIIFNWSDIKPLIQSGKVWFDRGVTNNFFWFGVQTVNKIPVGIVFVVDPLYGIIPAAVTSSYEYDTEEGDVETNDALVRVNSTDYYAVAVCGDTGLELDGWLRVLHVWSNNGTIQQSLVSSLEYDNSYGTANSIAHKPNTDIYVVAHKGDSRLELKTLRIYENGTISAVVDSEVHDTRSCYFTYISFLTDDILVVTYEDVGSDDTYIETYQINSDGTITDNPLDTQTTTTSTSSTPKFTVVDSDTIAAVSCDGDSDGFVNTWNISAAGIITNTYADQWEFDSTQGKNIFIKYIANTVYAVSYSDGAEDGWIKTFNISSTGMITKSFADTLEFADANTISMTTIFTVNNASTIPGGQGVYGITFKDVDGDGQLYTVNISSTGVLDAAIIDSLEFDGTDAVYGASECYVGGNYYLLAYEGTGNDGWACTVEIETYQATSGSANTPPTQSNPTPINGTTAILCGSSLSISVNDTEGNPMNITWWTNASGSWVQFGNNNTLANGTYYQTIANCTSCATYYWSANVSDGSGGADNWTNITYNFRMDCQPTATNLECENQTNPDHLINHVPYFDWLFSDSDSGQTQGGYHIQVGDDSDWGDGAEMLNNNQTVGTNNYTMYSGSTLQDGSTYYWRLSVKDSNGSWSNWTSTQTFEMNTIPEVPGLSSPGNGSQSMPYTVESINLTWGAVIDNESDSINYWYQYATDSAFTVSLVEGWTGGPTYQKIPSAGNLTRDTTYYWRIKAWDGLEYGDWSPWRYFHTDDTFTSYSTLTFGGKLDSDALTVFTAYTSLSFGGKLEKLNNYAPTITINFAGNLSESGGPYWQPPGESTILSGVWANGYYTTNSKQSESWIYINLTLTDSDSVNNAWLNWLNGSTWTNWTYAFTHGSGNYWDYNTSSIITTYPNCNYSFDIVANDTIGYSNTSWWNKTGIGGVYTRRYVQLNCTSNENISYSPLYFYNTQAEMYKEDRERHDQGSGTTNDTGLLQSSYYNDTLSYRYCGFYLTYFFDETKCFASTINNIYFHIWISLDTGQEFRLGWDEAKYSTIITNDLQLRSIADEKSTVNYDIGIANVNDTYNLITSLLSLSSPFNFTDNNIYNFMVGVETDDTDGDIPSIITNISISSFVILNIPDNETLNASHADTDSDGLSDWDELYNVFTNPFVYDTDNDTIGDYWEHLSGSDPNNYTDTYNTTSSTFTPYSTLTFGGKLNVTSSTAVTSIQPNTWNAGSPLCNNWAMYNFTFYQNGTGTIDIKITFNETNYSFVNYTTWASNGYQQYCANFTINNWATESMIQPKSGGLPITYLNQSVPTCNFPFGIRIWMPKSVTYGSRLEDFVIYTESSLI